MNECWIQQSFFLSFWNVPKQKPKFNDKVDLTWLVLFVLFIEYIPEWPTTLSHEWKKNEFIHWTNINHITINYPNRFNCFNIRKKIDDFASQKKIGTKSSILTWNLNFCFFFGHCLAALNYGSLNWIDTRTKKKTNLMYLIWLHSFFVHFNFRFWSSFLLLLLLPCWMIINSLDNVWTFFVVVVVVHISFHDQIQFTWWFWSLFFCFCFCLIILSDK